MQSPPPGFKMNYPSRKRKLKVDQHAAASGYGFTDESNPLHETNLISGSVVLSGSCAGSEQSENGKSSQDDGQSGSRTLAFGDNFAQDDQIADLGNIVHLMKHEEADLNQSGHSLAKTSSARSPDGSANLASEDGQRNERGNLIGEALDKKTESLVGKLATRVAEELWNGSLQLNSSVLVSAVAFFKSGEKMPDVKWSEFLEVKGKVRLDAFEKYIQDLPRSRNRGLMVISICCKDGSCKSGLAGMKEVAKGYKKRDIVGLAQLSKGIDLYICPRTDTIITILAKHGFFKGMAAVQDKQDSMIGCVVWRRSQAPSNSIVKKSELKKDCSSSEKPLRSSSGSCTGRVDEKDLSHARLAQKSTLVGLVTGCKTLDVEEEPKVIGSRQVQHESVTASTDSSIFLTSVSSHIPANQSASVYDAVSVKGKPSLHAEIPCSSRKKPKQTSVVHCPDQSFPSHVVTGHVAPPDDDLPEFDFGSARGVSQSPASKLSDSAVAKIEKKFIALPQESRQGSTFSTTGTLHSKPASDHRGFGDFIYPRLPPNALEELPFHKKIGDNPEEDRTTTIQNREQTHAPQGRMPVATTVVPPRRNLFDDEDDMPEWCPPYIELHKRLVPETKGSTSSIFSKVLNSSHENFSPCPPPNHLLPVLSKAVYSPPPTRSSHFPMSYRDGKPGEPRSSDELVLRGPNSLARINTDPLLRPPFNTFDAKVTVHPTGWRGRKP